MSDNTHEPTARNQEYIEKRVSEETHIDEKVVKRVFDAGWQAICRELEEGNSVKLHGKGTFYLSKRSGRMGRNPETGEEHPIPPREAMAFRTSPAYAKRLRSIRAEKQNDA